MEDDNSAILNVKSLDKYFPKGDKRRGEALAVCIEAFLEGKLTGKKLKHKKEK